MSGSRRSQRMPGVSVRKTSFSAFRCAATAAAAVSALTFSQPPVGVDGQRRDHRHDAGRAEVARSARRRRAVTSPTRPRSIGWPSSPGSVSFSPNRHWSGAGVQADGPAAELADLRTMSALISCEQDADDDVERGVVGVAAAVDLARLEAGGGHGAVDRLAAAVDQDGPQADGRHEDDVLQGGAQGVGVFHGAAAELDDRQPVAEACGCSSRASISTSALRMASSIGLGPDDLGNRKNDIV